MEKERSQTGKCIATEEIRNLFYKAYSYSSVPNKLNILSGSTRNVWKKRLQHSQDETLVWARQTV